MKLFGALMVLTGCLSLSFGMCRRRWQRMQLLRDLAQALLYMEGELEGSLAPLPQLMYRLSADICRDSRQFFSRVADRLASPGDEAFSVLWAEAAEQTLKELSPRERETVQALGESLGRYPLPMQLTAIARCRDFLLESEKAARQRYLDERRLIWGVPAAAALLLWIILI